MGLAQRWIVPMIFFFLSLLIYIDSVPRKFSVFSFHSFLIPPTGARPPPGALAFQFVTWCTLVQ